jgi:hypothetical protein
VGWPDFFGREVAGTPQGEAKNEQELEGVSHDWMSVGVSHRSARLSTRAPRINTHVLRG